MQKLFPILRPAALFGVGLIMAVLSAAVGPIPADMGGNDLSAAVRYMQTASPTPTGGDTSQIGSTDGIVWMGILIVLIVLTPVLLRKIGRAK